MSWSPVIRRACSSREAAPWPSRSWPDAVAIKTDIRGMVWQYPDPFKVGREQIRQFANAVKGGPPAMSNFPEYSGGLTETILLGNLALWAGKKVEWDAKNMKATKTNVDFFDLMRRGG